MKPRLPVPSTLKTGWRYAGNLVSRAAEQQGLRAALGAGVSLAAAESKAVLRWPVYTWRKRRAGRSAAAHPPMISDAILRSLAALPAPVEFCAGPIDIPAFEHHLRQNGYPPNYAGGPLDEGGMREQKALEYFVSLDLLAPGPGDTLIDVASQRSIFPEIAARLTGARLYRQDLIYPPGLHGDRIGGSAANMHIPDGFASQLVLHNAFEHFEGAADTGFVREAWRILCPGGAVCILPLFVTERACALTDPLVDRPGITWDPGAAVVELPWWHNRFGRFYDAASLRQRVLDPALALGFRAQVYHFTNVKDIHPRAYLHFGLRLLKPGNNACAS